MFINVTSYVAIITIIIIIIIIRIFIQEFILQHVMLLSTYVMVKLNGKRKKENSRNLAYYEKLQKIYIDVN